MRPIVLASSSPGLQLLERLRDEAHRFALAYFKKLHRRRTFNSAFDEVPGIVVANRELMIGDPTLIDMATTILALYDIDAPKHLTGRAMFRPQSVRR